MGEIIGFFIVLFVVVKACNKKIDSSRVKKWWGEDDK